MSTLWHRARLWSVDFQVGGGGSSTRKNTPTSGRLVSGAHVEREVASGYNLNAMSTVEYVLKDPDFTTAVRLAEAIDAAFEGTEVARVVDSATLELTLPEDFQGRFPNLRCRLRQLRWRWMLRREWSSTSVPAQWSWGRMSKSRPWRLRTEGSSIEVQRQVKVSQPRGLLRGNTAVVSQTSIEASEEEGQLCLIEGVSIGELVAALNNMG